MAIEKLTVQRCNRFINDCRKQKKTKILNDGGGLYIRATAGGTASREACLAHATGNAVSNAYARGEGLNFLVLPHFPARPSTITAVTDEAGSPSLDLGAIYPQDFPYGAGILLVIEMTAQLAPLFA